jgi:hypothetical protein
LFALANESTDNLFRPVLPQTKQFLLTAAAEQSVFAGRHHSIEGVILERQQTIRERARGHLSK